MQDEFFSLLELPRPELGFYWDHIYLSSETKYKALRLILTEYKIGFLSRDFALSKTIFFHGPPGCGKTMTVRALSNEAAKNLNGERCFFAELSFPSLRSHDYGESEKLVATAFKHIEELASANFVVFVLFDEVESVLTDRTRTLSAANPVDAFRGVNEVLKGIDNLSLNYSKVFFFATSNLLSTVDKAFLDRTDRAFYIGLPDYSARTYILCDLCEVLNKNFSSNLDTSCNSFRELVHVTEEFSGRQLRKLPAETISSSEELCKDPSKIRIDDLIRAAKDLKKLTKHRPRLQNNKNRQGIKFE